MHATNVEVVRNGLSGGSRDRFLNDKNEEDGDMMWEKNVPHRQSNLHG